MILDEIVAQTKRDLLERKAATPAEALREQIACMPAPLDMAAALRAPGVSIVAEIKRASPSRGVMNGRLEPTEQATLYAEAGADAISVLTEPHRFRGSLADLAAARRGLDDAGAARPILRKDFIVDGYQMLEARRHGADAVLLIAAALDDPTLEHLFHGALELGLTPLIEVHDEEELGRVLPLAAPMIGINNRNLKDLTVDMDVTRRLRPRIPPASLVVSESGIREPAQMRALRTLGVDAALIGEALVTAPDPRRRLRELKEAGQ